MRQNPSDERRACSLRSRVAGNSIASFLVMVLCIGSALGQCRSPLDEQLISELTFDTLYPSFQLQPGQTIDLNLSRRCCLDLYIGCCFALQQVNECTKWSLDDSSFAHIDPESGMLTVEQTALPGQELTVIANVENGRRVLTIPVFIYSADTHPLVGVWSESQRFSCKSGDVIAATEPIRELIFRADGTMYVSRFLFETYRDYIATYEFKLARRKVSFTIQFASVLPPKIDAQGRYKIVDGDLVLKELSFGRFTSGEPNACKYQFRRIGNEH